MDDAAKMLIGLTDNDAQTKFHQNSFYLNSRRKHAASIFLSFKSRCTYELGWKPHL
jgi:hypothetical protein